MGTAWALTQRRAAAAESLSCGGATTTGGVLDWQALPKTSVAVAQSARVVRRVDIVEK